MPTSKRGKWNVLICGCFPSLGIGPLVKTEGSIGRYKYMEILRNNMLSFVEELTLGL